MSNQLEFLDEQLELCGNQAKEAWKPDHEFAMACRRVEDVVGLLLGVLVGIRRHNDRWAESAQQEEIGEGCELCLANAYKRWLAEAKEVISLVDKCEEYGFEVKGAAKIRKAEHDVSLLPLDIEAFRQSYQSLQAGAGVPMNRAMDELRDRIRRRRALGA